MAFHEKLHPSASASVAPNATARPATRQSSTRGMLQSTFFVALKRSPLSCDETVAHRRQTRCRTSCACSCACVVILSCYAHTHVVRRLWISTDPNGRVHYGRCTDTVSPSSSVSGRSQSVSINQSIFPRPTFERTRTMQSLYRLSSCSSSFFTTVTSLLRVIDLTTMMSPHLLLSFARVVVCLSRPATQPPGRTDWLGD